MALELVVKFPGPTIDITSTPKIVLSFGSKLKSSQSTTYFSRDSARCWYISI